MYTSKFKRRLLSLLTLMVILVGSIFAANPVQTFAAMNYSEFPSGYTYPTQMRGLSAFDLVADMGAGWNLGNSLESAEEEWKWGNPVTTKAMIDAIAAKGFKTLRVPVRWDDHYSDASNYTIQSDYMDRVETVVNYGLANGMYVILNVHHNDLQTMVSTDSSVQSRVKNELKAIWTQVGNRFKNYGDKLIFEVNNEPRRGENWGGEQSDYDCVNAYNEAGRAAIRATGGNNSKRLILLPTYCASADDPKIYGWKNLSSDTMVAVSIHAYKPFDFAYQEGGHSNWTNEDYNDLVYMFDQLKSVFIDKGVPVVIGEFGATNKGNTSDREKYASIYASLASAKKIPCIWWDNNRIDTGAENFGIFNRAARTYYYDGIANAIVKAYNGGSDEITDDYVSLFWGEASSSNWGQAVSVKTKKNGGSFDSSNIKSGGHFYVEYSGESEKLELILQSWSGANEWAKVKISDSGSANGHYYAKFSYDNCVAAFGTSDFVNKLDTIHVGAMSGNVTVYSVCYDFGASGGSGGNSQNYTTLFSGESKAEPWAQAVTLMTKKNGGSFDVSTIKANGYFYVEYSGVQNQIEMIFQSWSGGTEWAKISPAETGQVNGRYYAKFKYQDCVNAFGTTDLAGKLDKVHVGAQQNTTTVYLLRYYV
ncbi:cellulase family glycosylhydrolase [Anaerosporobacter sp.]